MGEARRKGQEGNRWVNEMPDPKALSKWFSDNVAIHDGLDHKNYVQGVTLIPATEKPKEITGFDTEGNPLISQVENLVYVPYAKVETRVKYFNDLMEQKADEWFGLIEPVVGAKQDPSLPPGFFYLPVPTGDEKGVRFVCCTMKVTIYKRDGFEEKMEVFDRRQGLSKLIRVGQKVIDAPPATKMIPMLQTGWGDNRGERVITADPSSLMKAETGAIGRALGMAGMLVIPGTGVATAEDMSEALNNPSPQSAPATEPDAPTAELPADAKPPTNEELAALKNEHPDIFKLFQEWATGRGIKEMTSITDPAILRGLTAKATRDFQEAQEAKDAEAEETK
jgi:hypothetical protein